MCQGYPDGHAGTSVDEDMEIDRLKIKVDAGADFIVTQLFYDVDHFLPWYRKVRQKGSWRIKRVLVVTKSLFLGIVIPVIPGVMPIQTYSSFARVTKLCGARVPDSLSAELLRLSVRLFQRRKNLSFIHLFISTTIS